MATKKRILLLDESYDGMLPLKIFLETVSEYRVDLTAEKSVIETLCTQRYDLLIVDRMIAPRSLNDKGEEVENIQFENIHWHDIGPEFVLRLRTGAFSRADSKGTEPDVPVIMLSAAVDTSIARKQKEALRLVSYMEKPFDLEELVGVIENIFRARS